MSSQSEVIETTVGKVADELVRRGLASRLVESHVLERSWHVVTLDYDRDEVARLTADFLERVAGGAAPPADLPVTSTPG